MYPLLAAAFCPSRQQVITTCRRRDHAGVTMQATTAWANHNILVRATTTEHICRNAALSDCQDPNQAIPKEGILAVKWKHTIQITWKTCGQSQTYLPISAAWKCNTLNKGVDNLQSSDTVKRVELRPSLLLRQAAK